MQTESLLWWSGMTDTEHSTTSVLNEVVVVPTGLRIVVPAFFIKSLYPKQFDGFE